MLEQEQLKKRPTVSGGGAKQSQKTMAEREKL
jgi:hypothetical protein